MIVRMRRSCQEAQFGFDIATAVRAVLEPSTALLGCTGLLPMGATLRRSRRV